MSTPPEDTPFGERSFRENVPLSERRARRLAEAEERRKLEGDIWWFCCHLSERERRAAELARAKYEYEVTAKLHFDRFKLVRLVDLENRFLRFRSNFD